MVGLELALTLTLTLYTVNKQTSKPPEVMTLFRKLVLNTLLLNITLKAHYINTKSNAFADSISRCQWHRFRNLAPQADSDPTPLPPIVWEC